MSYPTSSLASNDRIGFEMLDKINEHISDASQHRYLPSVATISDLRNLTSMSAGDAIQLSAHTSVSYGGGGIFEYLPAVAKSATITASTDTLASTGHELYTGQSVKLYSLSGGAGLDTSTIYYVVRVDANSFKLATSYANAIAATPTVINITSDGSASVNYADDNGVWIVPSSNPASGRWKRRIIDRTISPRDFGAYGIGWETGFSTTADTNGLTNAIRHANTVGQMVPAGGMGLTIVIDGFFISNTGHKILRKVNIVGAGPQNASSIQINAAAGATLFDFFADTGSSVSPAGNTIRGLHLVGNANTQTAIRIGCRHSTIIKDMTFDFWVQGTCILLSNDRAGQYTEETRIDNCIFYQMGTAIYLLKGAGNASFSSTRISRCLMQGILSDASIQTGLKIGPSAVMYSGYLDFKINAQYDETVGIHLESGAAIRGSHVNVLYEGYVTAETLAGTVLKMDANSLFTGLGRIYNFSEAGDALFTIDATARYFLNSSIGNFDTVAALKTYPPDDLGHGFTATVSDVFGHPAIYKFDATSTATDTSATSKTVLQFSGWSTGRWLLQTSGPRIVSGTGAPVDDATYPQGSLYLRTDGSTTTTLYVKTASSTWTAK